MAYSPSASLVTDFGCFPLPAKISALYRRARKRKDGRLDRRTALGKKLLAWERRQFVRVKEAWLAGWRPILERKL